jgi:hypothetical protein
MYWHLGFMVGSLLLFLAVAWVRWQYRQAGPAVGTQVLLWLATAVFVVGAAFGGHFVYHGGTGIEGDLLKPGLHEEHHHSQGGAKHPGHQEDQTGHESSHEHH